MACNVRAHKIQYVSIMIIMIIGLNVSDDYDNEFSLFELPVRVREFSLNF